MTANLELRNEEDGTVSVIEGYALKFNRKSSPLGLFTRFVEQIDSRALDNTDMTNVVATFNHDDNQILGRTGANLELKVDKVGLRFTLKPIDTQLTQDLIKNMQAGVINQCSFAFDLPDSDEADLWEDAEDGSEVEYNRTIKQINKLYDVSIVTTPAYPDTEVSARSKEKIEELEMKPLLQKKRAILLQLKKIELLEK